MKIKVKVKEKVGKMRKTKIPDWFQKALKIDHEQVDFPKTAIEFARKFSNEETCLEYLVALKWPGGYTCPQCNSQKYGFIHTRNLIQCKKCNYQESPIRGTIFEGTHKSLSEWFWAVYFIATQKTGMSAMELYRQMNFGSYQTAWAWLHKLRWAMIRPYRSKLQKAVEVDETYIGGKSKEAGRKLGKKQVLVVVAVEIKFTKKGYPSSGRIRMRRVPDASAKSLCGFAKDNVEKGVTVMTDKWKGYIPLPKYGYDHEAVKIGNPTQASVKFPRVHRVISNLKAWLHGTHRFTSPKHIQNYLNEFTFRFNRRYSPHKAFRSLMQIAVQTEPPRYKELASKDIFHPNPGKVN